MNLFAAYRIDVNIIKILDKARGFIRSLDEKDRAKIAAAISTLASGDFQSVAVKPLRGPIRELIVKSYRIVFFNKKKTLWFVSGFRKKTRKTPPQEIKNAQKLFKILDQ